MAAGTCGLMLFPGMPPLVEAERGEFSPLSEQEMPAKLKTFVEHLTCDCSFITHHTVYGANLTHPLFLQCKDRIAVALEPELRHGDLTNMADVRKSKRSL
jgi:hypothetical protein